MTSDQETLQSALKVPTYKPTIQHAELLPQLNTMHDAAQWHLARLEDKCAKIATKQVDILPRIPSSYLCRKHGRQSCEPHKLMPQDCTPKAKSVLQKSQPLAIPILYQEK